MVLLGACSKGWVAVCAGPLLAGNLPEGAASHNRVCRWLGVKWELVAAKRGRMCWGEGSAEHGPRQREEDASLGVQQRSSKGIMFSSDTVSCCSIQLPAAAGGSGAGSSAWLRAWAPLEPGAVQGKELFTYRKPSSRISWLERGWLCPNTALA